MSTPPLFEKYERHGMPSLPRPDWNEPPGWSLRVISSLETIRNHTLSPDGRWVAFYWDRGDTSDLYVMAAEGGWPRRLTTGRGPAIPWDDEIPAWSPDSRWLAFTMDDHVSIVDIEGGLPRKVSDFCESASSPAWMPDSQRLLVNISRYKAEQILLTDRQGSWPKALTDGRLADSLDPRPSPDGRFIAFISRRFDDLKRFDLCLIDVQTGQQHLLCGKPGLANHTPRWRPDNEELAFLSQQSGFYEIWLVKPDGSELRPLTQLKCDLSDIVWSPNNDYLVCIANNQGYFELVMVNTSNGEAEILGRDGRYSRPNCSPDGRFLTYEFQNHEQPPDIFRLEMEDRQVEQLTFSKPLALDGLAYIEPKAVSFRSTDGLEIEAYIYNPKKPNQAGLLYLHGGPNDQYVPDWDIFLQYLAASGYTILCPNYRGSTGYGKEFERLIDHDWGGRDVQDCLSAADYLAGVDGVDPGRLGVMGPSYGGYLVNCILSGDPQRRLRCGVSIFGDANLLTSWAQCSLRLRRYTESYLGNPAENEPTYQKGSPVSHANNIYAPLLLLHGLEDDIVPPQASEEWANALRQAGKTYEYKTYAKEPHGFLRQANRLDAWERIGRFLNWYLLPVMSEDQPGRDDR